MEDGLSEVNAVGRAGGYRDQMWTEVLQLGTVIARGLEFFEPGGQTVPLLSLPVGPVFHREMLQSSWTGRTYRCSWDDASVVMHQRITLPGPMFEQFGRQLWLRFAFGNAPDRIDGLETGRRWPRTDGGLGRVLLLTGPRRPALLVASEPFVDVQVVSHEHVRLGFESDAARVMWVPLLRDAEQLLKPEILHLWVRLVRRPPLCCRESFEMADDQYIRIRQQFSDLQGQPSELAPIPPVAALLGTRGGLQHLRTGEMLTKTLLGPYQVLEGSGFDWRIDTSWMQAHLVGARRLTGEAAQNLAPIPEELAYAGDFSWKPGTSLDQCLALRVWAPLAGVMPESLWQQLKPQLTPPDAESFRQSLQIITEPFTKKRWAKDTGIFIERCEASYDADWYNGLTLAGLWRGACCADAEIADACRNLAREIKSERKLLVNYMWLLHDWGLCCSWTDPRGETWNLDCSHNGLEGVLAEGNLRRLEGDPAGAEQADYLAARMSVAFMAAFELADWFRHVGFVQHDGVDPHVGIDALREWRGGSICGWDRKGSYALTAHFFEYWYLLARHGPRLRLAEVADLWWRHCPQRYHDWERYYTGGKRTASQTLHQEERTQAAVMYHLAPEVGLRMWVLGQPGPAVEKMYNTPLNLAEQLWCRSNALILPGQNRARVADATG
ncbi:MAG TPA: hypothetical protein VMZ31_18470 [Phycisphaerae bacterium]|nr:hypothetical protein [Phycisphaerae bacterium]